MIWKKGNFKFSDKKHSVRGILSSVAGLAALIIFIAVLYISGKNKGNGGVVIGIAGTGALLLTIIGLVLGIKGFREKEIIFTFPIIGVVLNGLLFVTYLTVYLMGIYM